MIKLVDTLCILISSGEQTETDFWWAPRYILYFYQKYFESWEPEIGKTSKISKNK